MPITPSIFSKVLVLMLVVFAEHLQSQPPKEITNSIGMKLVLTPKGTFMMGSPESEEARFEDETQHEVTISKDYYLGVHEVTQAQYEKVMGTKPSYFQGDEIKGSSTNNPVESVSWLDAVEFCKKLSDLPEEKAAGRVYRLPTEAEWEYAARCGGKSNTKFSWGNTLVVSGKYMANVWQGSDLMAQQGADGFAFVSPVGSYGETACGLTDMGGNVWNWCADVYQPYPGSTMPFQYNPDARSIRGGSFFFDLGPNPAGERNAFIAELRRKSSGFRCAADAD